MRCLWSSHLAIKTSAMETSSLPWWAMPAQVFLFLLLVCMVRTTKHPLLDLMLCVMCFRLQGHPFFSALSHPWLAVRFSCFVHASCWLSRKMVMTTTGTGFCFESDARLTSRHVVASLLA